MKKIVLIVSLLVSCIASSQVRMTGTGISASNSSAFIDASSNTTNNGTVGNGKGLVFPRVDLSTFTFVGTTGVPNNYPYRYDGMIVYNTKTGGAANVGTTIGTLAPGFWFYENKSNSVTGGTWKVLGGSASKFIDGTNTAADAVFTGGNVGIGTSSPSASAALEVNSTTGGILISRMTSTQRDAINSPANGLLIYNTINNSFEVFKTACSCWVTIYDSGIQPASNLVNTAPKAENINYTGQILAGKSVITSYTYFDGQEDPEGLTTIKWQIAPNNSDSDAVDIVGASSNTYTIQNSNVGSYIRSVISPRASSGVLNGVFTNGVWKLVEAATTPTSNNLVITGTTAQGTTLNASYTFSGGTGIEKLDALTGTKYLWETASNAFGENYYTASLNGATRFTSTYKPESNLIGRYIRVLVKAVDSNGLEAQTYVPSPWVGPITLATETAPVASNLSYSPAPAVYLPLTSSYTFNDVNNDPEGATTFQWYTADDASGTNQVAISGATSPIYTVQPADSNKFIGFSVTPVALTGTTTGTTSAVYYNSSATLPVSQFTFTGAAVIQKPFFHANRGMTGDNAIRVEINATTAGGIIFTSLAQNGYSFSANVTVAAGTQWITLNATGTQSAYNANGDIFTINGLGFTSENKTIVINHTKLGADFSTHYNGWVGTTNATQTAASYTVGETFNNNGTCVSKPISLSVCAGSVTGASGTVYPVVNINGQCWMTRDLNEIPTAFTYSNTWFDVAQNSDAGFYGYANLATPNGTAGWAATAPVGNAGLLYQWSAAMNGATTERAQGICPQGFHVPSDCEWMYLEHGLGMKSTEVVTNSTFRNSGFISSKLRSTGTNISGFSMLITATRNQWNGVFGTGQNIHGTSTSSNASQIPSRQFTTTDNIWRFTDWSKSNAITIRCLKD